MRLDFLVSKRFELSRRAARDAVRAGRIESEGKVLEEPGLDAAEDIPLVWHRDRPPRHRVRDGLRRPRSR